MALDGTERTAVVIVMALDGTERTAMAPEADHIGRITVSFRPSGRRTHQFNQHAPAYEYYPHGSYHYQTSHVYTAVDGQSNMAAVCTGDP